MNANDAVGTRLGQLMDEAVRLAQAAWKAMLLYVVVLTGVGVWVDQLTDAGGANLMFSVATLALGFVLTVQLLRDGGVVQGALPAGFGSYFGLSLLSGFGMVLGVLLLVIPGIVLFVRWAPAYGYVMGEGCGISEGLGKAWENTRPHFWPIALALLVPVGVNLAASAVYFLGADELGLVSVPVSLAANLAISCAGAAITAIGIASYALLRDRSAQIAEVFA
jgi:hypothetical protein